MKEKIQVNVIDQIFNKITEQNFPQTKYKKHTIQEIHKIRKDTPLSIAEVKHYIYRTKKS